MNVLLIMVDASKFAQTLMDLTPVAVRKTTYLMKICTTAQVYG